MALNLLHALDGQFVISVRRLFGFLDKPKEQNHPPSQETKNHPGDSAAADVAANLP